MMYKYVNKLTGENQVATLIEEGIYDLERKEYYDVIKMNGKKYLLKQKHFENMFKKIKGEEIKEML